MPMAAKKVCNYPNCSETSDKGYCATHDKQRKEIKNKTYNRSRLTANTQGYNYKWQKKRIAFLTKHPLCVHCKAKGIVKPATELDHVIPHKGNRELFDNGDLQGLCKSCHSRKTRSEQCYIT